MSEMTLDRARQIVAQIEVMRMAIARMKSVVDNLVVTKDFTEFTIRQLRESNDNWDALGNGLLDNLSDVAETCVALLGEREKPTLRNTLRKIWSDD